MSEPLPGPPAPPARPAWLDRAAFGLALALAVGALLARPAARALSPALAATAAYEAHARSDPWGGPWLAGPRSAGPNGQDEEGAGDDVPVRPASASYYLFGWAPWLLGSLAGLLALTYALARDERTGLADEVGRAVLMAVPLWGWSLFVLGVLFMDRPGPPGPVVAATPLWPGAPVPTPVVLGVAAFPFWTGLVLMARLAQPQLSLAQPEHHWVRPRPRPAPPAADEDGEDRDADDADPKPK